MSQKWLGSQGSKRLLSTIIVDIFLLNLTCLILFAMYEQVKTECNMLVGGLLQMLTRPGKYSNITLIAAWDLQDHPRSAARSAAWCLAFMSFKLQWGLRTTTTRTNKLTNKKETTTKQPNWSNWRKANGVKESEMFKCCSRLDRKQLDAEAALLWGKQRNTWNRKH